MANHYRKKPVIIEAIQYTLETRNDVLKFLGTEGMSTQIGDYGEVYETEFIKIRTLEGVLRVSLNDWVIRGIKGEFYPCKPDIFEETYELVG